MFSFYKSKEIYVRTRNNHITTDYDANIEVDHCKLMLSLWSQVRVHFITPCHMLAKLIHNDRDIVGV